MTIESDLTTLIGEVAERHGFSGVVRVTADAEVLASAAFGYANRAHGVENTPDTRFGTASGTKLLTALTIGTLIDGSEVALDTRLHDVCSFDLSGVAEDVTIAHLLTHTSGVYDYLDEELIDDIDSFELSVPPHELLRPSDYLPMVVGGEPKFTPGERFSYSNSGYVLLGIVIEELCGDYHRAVESRVMKRAQMDRSGFFRLDALPSDAASGYIETRHGWRTNVDQLPIIGGPDGGAFVTVSDMERLWRAFLAGRIISPTLNRTFTSRVASPGDALFYGHGVWIHKDSSQPSVIYVMGSDAGVSFKSSCHGDSIIATIASNTSDGAWPVAKAIDTLLRGAFSDPGRSRRVGCGPGPA